MLPALPSRCFLRGGSLGRLRPSNPLTGAVGAAVGNPHVGPLGDTGAELCGRGVPAVPLPHGSGGCGTWGTTAAATTVPRGASSPNSDASSREGVRQAVLNIGPTASGTCGQVAAGHP